MAEDSIKYKSVVVTLISVVIALVSFVGGSALIKLEAVATAVTTMQATQSLKDAQNQELSKKVEQLNQRMDTMDRQLTPQIEYLTMWLNRTFGRVPDRTGKPNPQFGRERMPQSIWEPPDDHRPVGDHRPPRDDGQRDNTTVLDLTLLLMLTIVLVGVVWMVGQALWVLWR